MMRLLCSATILMLGWSAARVVASETAPNDASQDRKPPGGAIVLFDGGGLDGWVKSDGRTAADWPVKVGVLTVGAGSIRTARTFGDFELHLEFNVPYMPQAKGQARGNSGVYLDGIHELQVLDSYG